MRSFRPAFEIVVGIVSGIASTLSIVWIMPPTNKVSCFACYHRGILDDRKPHTAVTIVESALIAEYIDTVPF